MSAKSISFAILFSLSYLVLASGSSFTFGQDDAVFAHSFEDCKPEVFEAMNLGKVSVTATGTASISERFAHTGKQCLHLLGDQDNSITFSLPRQMQSLKGISFHAERWTSKAPFKFSVEIQQAGRWKEIAKLDQITQVGARFLSHIKLVVPGNQPTRAIRFKTVAAAKAGLLIDDLVFHSTPPPAPTPLVAAKIPSVKLELVSRQTLFKSGKHDTHTFRIPAIATATNGDLIAACDARRKSSADLIHQREIDIVFRRSEDQGKTWTPMEVMDPVVDGGCSDPSLLVDEITGDIFCFYNFMPRDMSSKVFRFYVQKSSDHGKSWSDPVDMTDQVAGPELKNAFKFITSGRGIQTRDGLLMHNFVRVGKGITLFSSDDHGKRWSPVGEVAPGDESKVAQLPDGSFLVNSRVGPGRRAVHRSTDGGATWKSEIDWSLPDPRCNAGLIQYTAEQDGYEKDRLIFCNAASNQGRKNLAVRISYDGGVMWSEGRVIEPGAAAYSEITILKDGSLGVLYEPGYTEIRFVKFTLEALTGGKDKLSKPWASPIGRSKHLPTLDQSNDR